MDNAGYTTLTRQSGLMYEMQVVANNIANAATTGYRQEGLVFSEFVQTVEQGPSLSMAAANVRQTSQAQGSLTQTGGTFDLAIEGQGFFLIETPNGERLTRAGSFSPNAAGDLVTPDGDRVLDAGGAPVFVPPGVTDLNVSADGTVSAEGQPITQIGLYQPLQGAQMLREDGVMFRSQEGVEPVLDGKMLQGFLESSNVNPLSQIARMIEVQRAYEMGQNFMQSEDERIRNALDTMTR
ncbi:MAG: flagellar hook-basal body complex protein [Thalassovita sp.]